MSYFNKSVGERLKLSVNRNGYIDHVYSYGASLEIRQGWNDSCGWSQSNLSIDDLKDLRYLIDRALENAKDS